jgi:single-strand DNA-binding protein
MMMASVNKVILVGNVGRDPEVRYLNNGDAVANLSLATTNKYKRNDEWVEDTQWHRIVGYKRAAEIIQNKINKGMSVYVEGTLKYRQYEKDGVKMTSTEIVANEIHVLGGKPKPKEAEEEVPF